MLLAAIRSSVLTRNFWAIEAGLSPACTMYVCSAGGGVGEGAAGGATTIGVAVGGLASAATRLWPIAQFRPTYRKPASARTTTAKPMMYGPYCVSRRAWPP